MHLADKKKLVARFISRCNEYAESKLAHYRAQLAAASGFEALAIQDKIGHWTAYRAFNEYTLRELEGGELDPWLE